MLDIIFTFCMLSNPSDCKKLRIETELEDTQFVQCIYKAEELLAKYVTSDRFVNTFGCIRRDIKEG